MRGVSRRRSVVRTGGIASGVGVGPISRPSHTPTKRQDNAMPANARNTSTLPFAGIKVIDIANFLAGPMSSMFLGDYGAEVVKVERPGTGDEVRYWGNNKNGVGLMYKFIDRKSTRLNSSH